MRMWTRTRSLEPLCSCDHRCLGMNRRQSVGTPTPSGFPHQLPPDQFFDADQFEAYRAFGSTWPARCLRPVAELAEWQTVSTETHDQYKRRVRRIFATLRSEWYPLPTELRDQYIESGDIFDRLTTGLEPRLAGLVRRFYPELTSAITANTSSQPVLDGGADLRLQSMVPELGTFLEGLSDDATARLMVVNQIVNTMEATLLSLRPGPLLCPSDQPWVGEWVPAVDDFARLPGVLADPARRVQSEVCSLLLERPIERPSGGDRAPPVQS